LSLKDALAIAELAVRVKALEQRQDPALNNTPAVPTADLELPPAEDEPLRPVMVPGSRHLWVLRPGGKLLPSDL
jgi:hypothetical protein